MSLIHSLKSRCGLVTLFLGAVSIIVYILMRLSNAESFVQALYISSFYANVLGIEIRQGQIWRLVTPIFVHFDLLHLALNLMGAWFLGCVLESLLRRQIYIMFVVVTAILSNLGQYWMTGPAFGGLSGVVYGMFGYLVVDAFFNPRSKIVIPLDFLWLFLVFYVVGFTGVFGNLANTAHTVGLLVGAAFAALPIVLRR